ncbi:MAG: class I SAM-dependent methyltransferase [Verrucomicrobiota bacterium]
MGFDRLAPFYRSMEALAAGGKLQRCRVRFLAEIPPPRNILIAGEGHGRFLPECVRLFPQAHITVVDSSRKMLEIARRKTRSERVDFIHADFLELIGPSARYDLIVTHFFLDCFPPEPLAEVVRKLGNMATPNAHWLLADFEIAPSGAARWRSLAIVSLLYRFFRSTTGICADRLISPDAEMAKAGFIRHRRETFDWGLLKSEWWIRD